MSIRAFLAAATLAVAPMIALNAQITRTDSVGPTTWKGKPLPAPTTTTQARSDVLNDSAFIRQALTGNVLEVRLGKVAQSKASNAAVKQFGQQMVTDHSRMQSQWATFALRNGLPVKVTLDPAQEQSARQLEQLSGTAFDQAYMSAMLQEHQHAQDLFQNQGARADAPEARQMSATDLTTIQQHLSMAQQVASQIGVNGNVAVTTPSQGRSDVRNDSAFIRQALTGNILEVRLGKLAQSKATNAAVKQFGQQMITDHSRMQSQWATFALRSGLPVKATLDPAQESSARQLEQLSGTSFDQAYMTVMLQDHQHDQDVFQNQGARADAPEVRQMAAADLTTIQQHVSMAQQVASQIGVNTNVATTRQSTAGGNVANPRARNDRDRDDLKVYLHEVADDHLMQVQLGQLAQRRAKKGEVKQLARQIVDDLDKWQDRWTDLAKKQGMGFRPALGPMHRDLVDRVEKASNGNFDRIYLSTVADNLQSMVSDLRNADRNARWRGVRNLADDELKVVQQHLAAARRQQEKLNNRASK